MKKLLKNSIQIVMIISIFCGISLSQNNNHLSLNEKIELVHNISPLINESDSTIGNIIDDKKLLTIINNKIGIRYKWGAEGKNGYDCSGFVWKVFDEYSFIFQRSRARDYWKMFKTVEKGKEYQFGNLVFFSNLKHVGIVVDEKGFYHASSSKGITYSKFNNYWKSRIYGFKKIK